MLARYSELQDRFRLADGYQHRLKVATVLRGLGFEPDATASSRPSTSPAAGRCASRWPSCCSSEPDLLLLDEPTNHLDLDARNWLEEYLVAYPHAVILVSHDRYFLDAVVTRIADLTLRKITDYVGNYTQVPRAARRERSSGCATPSGSRTKKSQRVEEFINRFRYQATKAAQVQSRIKMLDKVERDRSAARAQAHPLPVSRRRRRAAAWCSS